MPPRPAGVLWQLVLITIQILSPCMSVRACICVEPRRSLRGRWSASDFPISHVRCTSRSQLNFLKGACEFSCVTWTTITTFRQQMVQTEFFRTMSGSKLFTFSCQRWHSAYWLSFLYKIVVLLFILCFAKLNCLIGWTSYYAVNKYFKMKKWSRNSIILKQFNVIISAMTQIILAYSVPCVIMKWAWNWLAGLFHSNL